MLQESISKARECMEKYRELVEQARTVEEVDRFLRIFFPKDSREKDNLFKRVEKLVKVQKLGTGALESLINDISHTISLGIFRKVGSNERFIMNFVNYFTGYDIREIDFNPFQRYLDIAPDLVIRSQGI